MVPSLFCSMAVDYPLVLYDCSFEGLSWQRDSDELNHVLSTLQQHWTQSAVRSHVLHGMIQGLEAAGGYSWWQFLVYKKWNLPICESQLC